MDNQDRLQDAIDKSQDSFDKQLVAISSGALAVSVGLANNVVELTSAKFQFVIVLAWVLLLGGLVLSLYSHLYSTEKLRKTLKNLAKCENEELSYPELNLIIDKQNSKIETINISNFFIVILGIASFVFFLILNIF
ncbi:MAG: hypothetical protein WD077_10355 [Bacteroidia bacterium]